MAVILTEWWGLVRQYWSSVAENKQAKQSLGRAASAATLQAHARLLLQAMAGSAHSADCLLSCVQAGIRESLVESSNCCTKAFQADLAVMVRVAHASNLP